jgi:manganese oxidase
LGVSDPAYSHGPRIIIEPIDFFLVAWFVVAALSAVYVAWDQFRNNPEPGVMRWAFILVTLYMGPIGLLFNVLADKEPHLGTPRPIRRRT